MIATRAAAAVSRVLVWIFLVLSCARSRAAENAGQPAGKPLAPADTPARIRLPEGFSATLFAGEPDVTQPIGMTIDDRGRLWVVENFSYPGWKSEGKDRVVVFEDSDGDGHFDSRKVFFDRGVNLTSVAVGFHGVWLLSVPNLLFVPDADGDDVPDGPAQTLLDGWNLKEAGHNAVNNLTWGPDGWLYGLNGIQSKSLVGKPGAADAERVRMDCGVWRYHPTRRVCEAVAHGTTNPWGLDFDDYGQGFITNCVIGHLWHVIPGAHYERMYGQDVNLHSYGLMPGCADHLHWIGSHWTGSRGNAPEQNDVGGGHAHVGAMICLGDAWPETYRNSIFTCNLHGNRVNRDVLEQRGSGYVAHHAPDFMTVADSWFRGISILQGPDGGVFVSDWSDTGECHNHKAIDQSNGRIYKITYSAAPTRRPNASAIVDPIGERDRLVKSSQTTHPATFTDAELTRLLDGVNTWHARHATRLLQERADAGKLLAGVRPALERMVLNDASSKLQLREMWALHAIGGLDDSTITQLLRSRNEYVRGWAIQLELEDRTASSGRLAAFTLMAKSDPSPVVRMFLASGLQRLPVADRWSIADELLTHKEDAADKSLSLMMWYGFEPLVPADMARALGVAATGENPIVRRYAARRAVEHDLAAGLDAVLKEMGDLAPDNRQKATAGPQSDAANRQLDLLSGAYEALGGQRHVAMPAAWQGTQARLASSSDARIRSAARRLAVLFGDQAAIEAERRKVLDSAATLDDRREAIDALGHIKDNALPPLLFQVLDGHDPGLARAALRSLAGYDVAATPAQVLDRYSRYDAEARSDAISTLASRASWAEKLLAAIDSGKVPRGDLQAYHIQQLLGLENDKLTARIQDVWGAVRPTAADKKALMQKYQSQLDSRTLSQADLSRGRAVFVKNCASCHTLYGAGGKIGPDLTGSQRSNLDYVLSNVLDPSAVVAREYQLTLVQTDDGRTITGIIKHEDDKSLTLQTATEQVTLPKSEVESQRHTKTSIMPDGLLAKLSDREVRDLVAYLASRQQAPLEGE